MEQSLSTPATINLGGQWSLTRVSGPAPERWEDHTIAAVVPGSVHTDLLAAGLIPDPYLDENERLLAWIGQCEWQYMREFNWVPYEGAQASLIFHGLDTVAHIRLNGVDIASTKNMHRTYTFDVTEQLRPGRNDLSVTFESAIKFADAESLKLGYRPHVNHHPYNAIRKMACSFGWDWGIDTATAGIWKDVVLVHSATARLGSTRIGAQLQGETGTVNVDVEFAHAVHDGLSLSCVVEGIESRVDIKAGTKASHISIVVEDPEKWWPVGYGAQRLYDVVVTLQSDAGVVLDRHSKRVGFRSLRADTTADSQGTPFTLVVNETPIFVKGANWIPDDAFPHRVDRTRYAARLAQARFANINLLRVWGGGIYEKDEFFDLCDEMGILTWQDYLFACAAYSEDQVMATEIEAEARDNTARIAHHPSLVVLNGNNENLWGFEDWNWQRRLQGKSWGSTYYYEMLPSIAAELAPAVAYTPGSPFSPGEGQRANDPSHGTMHIWDLWNERDYPAYREYKPRFVAEFGWQGPPTWSTMTDAIADQPLTPESPGMIVHQKAALGNFKLTDGLVAHFDLPNEMHDWHWAMSLNQANAVITAIEHFRSLAPTCGGSIVWQLNDCWPVTSWAAVDGAGRAKPLLYALRRAYAERLITIQPSSSGFAAIMVNDSASAWDADYSLAHVDYSGATLGEVRASVTVPPRSVRSVEFPANFGQPGQPSRELLRARADDKSAEWFFSEYRDSQLEVPRWSTRLDRVGTHYSLHVSAENLVRDVSLLIDKIDPTATANSLLATLLPGEAAVIEFDSSLDISVGELTEPQILRCANQLVSR